jgi:cytochrome c biogenesis protein ResB
MMVIDVIDTGCTGCRRSVLSTERPLIVGIRALLHEQERDERRERKHDEFDVHISIEESKRYIFVKFEK